MNDDQLDQDHRHNADVTKSIATRGEEQMLSLQLPSTDIACRASPPPREVGGAPSPLHFAHRPNFWLSPT